ncbi:hypothetical protein llap_15711 [Limosa lapponica baueri]|uniref:Uncharacterized protein n=1 Tax=Limosa lapponica baueri TaxID=1758121 RepID=A0A2I0TJP0_LIMLA|nr:hypothetical protein llap_15711 [Limosa lapponica baueri]
MTWLAAALCTLKSIDVTISNPARSSRVLHASRSQGRTDVKSIPCDNVGSPDFEDHLQITKPLNYEEVEEYSRTAKLQAAAEDGDTGLGGP